MTIWPHALYWLCAGLDFWSTARRLASGRFREGNAHVATESGGLRWGKKLAVTIGLYAACLVLAQWSEAAATIALLAAAGVWAGAAVWNLTRGAK
jgi:hypothetical protein